MVTTRLLLAAALCLSAVSANTICKRLKLNIEEDKRLEHLSRFSGTYTWSARDKLYWDEYHDLMMGLYNGKLMVAGKCLKDPNGLDEIRIAGDIGSQGLKMPIEVGSKDQLHDIERWYYISRGRRKEVRRNISLVCSASDDDDVHDGPCNNETFAFTQPLRNPHGRDGAPTHLGVFHRDGCHNNMPKYSTEDHQFSLRMASDNRWSIENSDGQVLLKVIEKKHHFVSGHWDYVGADGRVIPAERSLHMACYVEAVTYARRSAATLNSRLQLSALVISAILFFCKAIIC